MPRQNPFIIAISAVVLDMLTQRIPVIAAAITAVLITAQAHAASPQVSLEDDRFLRVSAEYGGQSEQNEYHPDAPFASWDKDADASADVPDAGSADSHASQFSGTIDSLGFIGFKGSAWGEWGGNPEGSYSVNSHVRFKFRLLACTVYTLSTNVSQGTCIGGFECAGVSLEGPGGLIYERTEDGSEERVQDRLPAGEYVIEGHSQGTSSELYFDAGNYSAIWNCSACPSSIILEPPQDKKVPPGSDPTLIASASVPTGHMTYQWRLNLVPLVDDGRITGAQTPVLTIHNVAAPDEGYYDIVFTDSSNPFNVIVEPSQLAHLELDTVSGVGVSPPPRVFSLSPASPNPFTRATTFRYEAATPMRIRMAIYNVAGARVRALVDEVVSGPRTITWDGTVQSGTRAPAGIYYLRVEAGALRENRKIVLLR